MAHPSLSSIVAEEWDRALTLQRYGSAPLTIGWWRGSAYLYLWDWRTGRMSWKPFQTGRPEPPVPPAFDPFSSRWLYEAMR